MLRCDHGVTHLGERNLVGRLGPSWGGDIFCNFQAIDNTSQLCDSPAWAKVGKTNLVSREVGRGSVGRSTGPGSGSCQLGRGQQIMPTVVDH